MATDVDRIQKGMANYARICVELDLSEGLPEQITLNWNSQKWVQHLEF